MIKDKTVILHWISTILSEGTNLTKWEEDFVHDLESHFQNGFNTISDRQEEILERIYSEKTP